MSAPDWPAVERALYLIDNRQALQPDWGVLSNAARWALVHGPALEAAEEVWWCETHNSKSNGALGCDLWINEFELPDNPCTSVKRPLLPKIEEGK